MLTRILSIAALAEYIACSALILHAIPVSPRPDPISRAVAVDHGTLQSLNNVVKVRSALPVRLKIPKINVDALVDQMGTVANGDMEAPSDIRDVGWFKLGTRPGDKGSAVIDGHYGRLKNGTGSVFDDLNKLLPGDSIYLEDADGGITTFVVRESSSYDPQADASDIFNSNDGQAHLNLITCEGVWRSATKSYSKRLVVFADKE